MLQFFLYRLFVPTWQPYMCPLRRRLAIDHKQLMSYGNPCFRPRGVDIKDDRQFVPEDCHFDVPENCHLDVPEDCHFDVTEYCHFDVPEDCH